MTQVSRPLLAALAAMVVFLGVWLVALKPSSSSNSQAPAPAASSPQLPGVAGLSRAIAKAHGAVKTSDAASAAAGGEVATTPSAASVQPATPAAPAASAAPTPTTPAAANGATAHAAKPAVHVTPAAATASDRHDAVVRALARHEVLALLFFNAGAADDRAVQQELAAVPESGRQVLKLAIPLSELSRYPMITGQVQVQAAPTLVFVDRLRQATTIVGFADRFEIAQRIADALSVR
jgi:hypothetical protein